MTSTTAAERFTADELRPRAWVVVGAVLLAGSIGITWVLAGVWIGLGFLSLMLGVGLTLGARRLPPRPRLSPRSADGVLAPAAVAGVSVDLLETGLRHDLPLMAGLCRGLPSGGLPKAGLLAEHTYVVVDAVRQMMGSAVSPGGPTELAQVAVADQLSEVERRAGRLYSSERLDGLDDLDWHLARLWVVVDDYLSGSERAPSPIRWCVGHRRRARVLAWSATAAGVPMGRLLGGLELRTELWLLSGIAWRARRRARRLWGRDGRVVVTGRQA